MDRIFWVQASSRPEPKRPDIQSPNVQASRVQASRPCVQSPAFPVCHENDNTVSGVDFQSFYL